MTIESLTYGGAQKEVKLPDGSVFVIREQNGADDDVISKVGDNENNTALSKFLSNIIISPKMSWQQVQRMKSACRYYLLLESRVFNFGGEFCFKHKFQDGTEVEFEEDLSTYIIDWDNYNPEDFTDKPFHCKPYPNKQEGTRLFKTSTGKELQYNYLNGEAEELAIKVGKSNIRKNDELRVRELSIVDPKTKTGWRKIERFNEFSAKEMIEIRKDIRENDATFDMIVELKNPTNQAIEYMPMIAFPEFFFPE